MPTWIRFREHAGFELCVNASQVLRDEKTVKVYDLVDASHCWTVHLDDSDRVWKQLCAMCDQSEVVQPPKPKRTGPDVRRSDGKNTFFFIGDREGSDYAAAAFDDYGFPADKFDALGEFIAGCVGGTYVGEKST